MDVSPTVPIESRPRGEAGKLTDEERLEIQRLAITGKYSNRRIAQLIKCSPQTVCANLNDNRALAESIIKATLVDAAHAVIKSYPKRPSIALDILDRFHAIPPAQTSMALAMPTIIFQTTGNVGVAFTLPHLPSSPPASLSPPIIEGETAKHDENIE